MIRFRKRGLALMGTAVLSAATVGVIPAAPASAAPRALAAQGTPFAQAQFAAYGTGSEISVKAVTSGATTLARVDEAFSANTASSGGLGAQVVSPITGALVQTDQSANAANAYGRGSGLEVGLGVTPGVANQIQAGIAEAHAPPTTGLITKTALPVNIPGLVNVGALTGKAAAAYSASFCPVGQPLAYGEGDAAAPTAVAGTPPPTALVSGTGASGSQAAQSTTRTDLVANTDGSFGIATTVTEIIAPVTINLGVATIAVTVQGDGTNIPYTGTAFNNGEGLSGFNVPTHQLVSIAITVGGVTTTPVLNVPLATLASVLNPLLAPGTGTISTLLATVGVTLTAGANLKSALPGAPAGAAAGSYDLLALNAAVGGLSVADLKVGHIEAEVLLPNGPIECTVPVNKVATPASVVAGSPFTWTISVPANASSLSDSTCDLTNIKVTDKISVNSGTPSFTIGTISNGGVYTPTNATSGTVTWANVGNYHPGDPPIQLSVNVTIPATSAAGVLQDTATVSAGLGNCTGGASGQATLIGANVGSAIIGGSVTLVAPAVSAAASGGTPLAATGTGPMLPWIAAGLLIMAEGTRRLLRRARSHA